LWMMGYLSIDIVGEWQPEEQVDEDQHDDENDEMVTVVVVLLSRSACIDSLKTFNSFSRMGLSRRPASCLTWWNSITYFERSIQV
jgi:hypothetical protein